MAQATMKDMVNLHNWTASQVEIGRHLKSIAFTKFDFVQLLLAVNIRMRVGSKEKRTLFKKSPKLCFCTLEIIKHEKNGLRLFYTACICTQVLVFDVLRMSTTCHSFSDWPMKNKTRECPELIISNCRLSAVSPLLGLVSTV